MTTLFLRRIGNALHGDGDEAVCELLKLPFGKSLKAEIRQPRNPAFHRLFFALCHRVADGIGSDAESIATIFKIATGHTETVKTKSYGLVKIPKSISFAQMDETSFREFFDRCIVICFREWGLEPEAFSDLLDPKTEKRA